MMSPVFVKKWSASESKSDINEQFKQRQDHHQPRKARKEKISKSRSVVNSESTSTIKPPIPVPELKDPSMDYNERESAKLTAARIFQNKQKDLGLQRRSPATEAEAQNSDLPIRTTEQPYAASSVASTIPTVLPVRNASSRPTVQPIKRPKAASTAPSTVVNPGKSHGPRSEAGQKTASECNSCLEDIDAKSSVTSKRLECCRRTVTLCQGCFNDWIVKTMDSEGKPPKCPKEGCESLLSHRDVTTMATGDALDKYERNATLAALQKTDEFYNCATPGCKNGQLMVDAKRNPRMDCPVCKKASCVIHATAWHKGETCEQYEKRMGRENPNKSQAEAASEAFIARNSKPCPKCNVPRQRTFGCDNMKCGKCESLYCWHCLAVDEEVKDSIDAGLRRWHFSHCVKFDPDFSRVPTKGHHNAKKGKQLMHVPNVDGDGGGIGDYRTFGGQHGHMPQNHPFFMTRDEGWDAQRRRDYVNDLGLPPRTPRHEQARHHSSDEDDSGWVKRLSGNHTLSDRYSSNNFPTHMNYVDVRYPAYPGQWSSNGASINFDNHEIPRPMQHRDFDPLGGPSLQSRTRTGLQHDYRSGQLSGRLPYGYRQFPGTANSDLASYNRNPDRWPSCRGALRAFHQLHVSHARVEPSWFRDIPMPSDIEEGRIVVLSIIQESTDVDLLVSRDRQQFIWDCVLEDVYGLEPQRQPHIMVPLRGG